jgi:hypothetical protein
MAFFLESRGVDLAVDAEVLTSDNIIAYLQHKKLGTPTVYAWLDLTKGDPDFARGVSDWQIIRQERGIEFAPAFVLLSNAKLTTKKDGEVWADIFQDTFRALAEHDSDKKIVMLLCLLYRLPHDLRGIEPPAAERLAFLAEELETPDMPKPYRQMISLALYEADFFANRFAEAARWARNIEPPVTGLALTFIAHALATNVEAATVTFKKLEKAAPEDKEMLDKCRALIRQLTEVAELRSL